MSDSKKVDIQINIAGETLSLSVAYDQQDLVREAEKRIAGMYDTWRVRFPKRSKEQLLAMIAYQYASYYVALEQHGRKAESKLLDIESNLDMILKA